MGQTTEAHDLLDRLRAGDPSARDLLIALAEERFAALARAMLRRYPQVRRWEETDDLLQAALMRLHRSLAEVRPEDVTHFDNLAAVQIRRELIDLARSLPGTRRDRGQPPDRRHRPRRPAGRGRRKSGQTRVSGGVDDVP